MEKQNYFRQALSDFAFDAAGGGAIRHLTDLGYTVRQIEAALDVPVPYKKIQQTVWERLLDRGVILLIKPGSNRKKERTVFIEERGKFGKKSFRRVTISDASKETDIHWVRRSLTPEQAADLSGFLSRKCPKNDSETAYLSCDFGIWQAADPKRYQRALTLLDARQREYVEGLPWPKKRVYHRLDPRMTEIAGKLVKEAAETFYFEAPGKKNEAQ